MSNALDWIRSKATVNAAMSETLNVEGVEYRCQYEVFSGHLPYRMRRELAKAKTVSTDLVQETLRIVCTSTGHETGEVKYYKATYTAA